MRYNPDQIVCLNIPGEASHIITPDGHTHLIHVDDRGRYINIAASLAHQMLASLPASLDLREANHELVAAFGRYIPPPGISLRTLEEQQRAAIVPPSKNQILDQTLADWRTVMMR